MKKILTFLVGLLAIVTLTSCNNTIKYQNQITLTLTSEWQNVITTNGAIPYRHFNFDGELNVYETSTSMGVIFTKNDNYFLSNAFAKHLQDVVGENYIIISEAIQNYDDNGALFGKEKKVVDEGSKSVERSIVSWSNDGTRYSYLFRTFKSNGAQYFVYTYNTGITISMDVPLIVQKIGNEQKIFMVSLPYDTRYVLNVNTKIKSLQKKSEYLDDKYHQFAYPDYLKDQDQVQGVKDWYITYCQGKDLGDTLTFTYIGINYKVTFNSDYFSIYVVEALDE